MRVSHILAPGAFALALMFAGGAFAFSTEQIAPQSTTGVQIADPDEKFEDMTKSDKTTGNGFFITGGVGQNYNSDSPFDANRPAVPAVPYGYLPMPTFRSR